MAILSLLRSKKIVWATFFSALAIVLFSLSANTTFSTSSSSSLPAQGAEVVDVSRDPDTSERGTYRVYRNGNKNAIITTQNTTKKESNENCKNDKIKYWTSIKCSWEENKKTTIAQTGSSDDDIITFSVRSGIIACGNPDKKDYIRYSHKDNKISIKKNDCHKKWQYIWIVCNGKPTNIKDINIFKRGDILSCSIPGALSGSTTLGTYIKYFDEKTTPSRVIKNVTKTYAYLNCKASLIFNEHHSIRCTWNDVEIFSYQPPVKETVSCIFSGSTTTGNTCSTTINSKLYSCKNTKANFCKVEIVGKKWTKLIWTSTFGANQESILDGKNKTITFSNSNLPPPIPTGTYKLFLSGSTTPTTTKTNITQDDALASCIATEASIDANTTIVCTWNDTEIHSRIIVTSQVTCVFSWATTTESTCRTINSNFSCTWINSCSVSISGSEWYKVTWTANNDDLYRITTILSTENQTITFPVP